MTDQLCDDILQTMPKVLAQKIAKDAIHFSYARTRTKNKINDSLEMKQFDIECDADERHWLMHQHANFSNAYDARMECPHHCDGINCECNCELCTYSYTINRFLYDTGEDEIGEWMTIKAPHLLMLEEVNAERARLKKEIEERKAWLARFQ
jgi:hypothetical protein